MDEALPERLESNARIEVKVGGVSRGIRRTLNFASGLLTAVDNATGEEVTLTIDGAGIATVLAGNGLDVSGSTLVVDPEEFTTAMAGVGLAANGDALDVNVDGSTLEINVDTLRVKDSGITSAKILDGTIAIADLAAAVELYIADGGDIKAGVWATAPSVGWKLIDGSTVTGASSSYPETWANAPIAWRSGSDLILPDWRGMAMVNFKTGDANFGTLAAAVGAATVALPNHIHPLSDSAWAKIRGDIETLDDELVFREIDVGTSWTATEDFTATAAVNGSDTSSNSRGVGLGGATDNPSTNPTSSTIQPSATVNWAICLK